MMKQQIALLGALSVLALAAPAAAQEAMDASEGSVYEGDYLSVGLGGALTPSYSGSDDYVVSPVPIVQGSFADISISPRSGGVSLDFIPDPAEGVGFDLGVAGRLRIDRASQISDPVVKSLGELDRAIELGPSVGLSFPAVLNPYDGLSIGTDVLWDVNGAHGGMVVDPSISYFTPLSRGIAGQLSLSAEYADGDFHDYYFRVSPAQSAATGGELPVFEPQGGGFTSLGATLLLGFDLNGELADGGWGIVAIAGYSRVIGDARDTPYTSVRGTPNQLLGALGIGYTF